MATVRIPMAKFREWLQWQWPRDVEIQAINTEDGAVVFQVPGDGEFTVAQVNYERTETMVMHGTEPKLMPSTGEPA